MSYEAFLRFLANGHKRAPKLYGGEVVHEPVPEAKKPISVAKKSIPEMMAQERVDFQKRAAKDDDWDGVEE